MKSVFVLEAHDVIDKNDWCRPLEITSMDGGRSDYFSFKNQYSGTPQNNVKWVRVKDQFGSIWFGKTVLEFTKMGLLYEFIRGDIPKSHAENMSGYTRLRN